MVGEIRDRETATMAIQSSLTGHEVFSTLHTNDAASAITRLLDLGIEPYLLASSIVGVLAQRLVRKVCTTCSRPRAPLPGELESLGLGGAAGAEVGLKHGAGCAECRGTGYRGRLGIFELLLVDDAVRERIQLRASAAAIKAAALEQGMQTLRGDGIAKALAGLTTPEEVVRVTV
jgi:type II secretory ATPase GspE/PulE/Tfp pilus assembly ATPase PilB-like protein